jgi:hypothetical protein
VNAAGDRDNTEEEQFDEETASFVWQGLENIYVKATQTVRAALSIQVFTAMEIGMMYLARYPG